MIQIRNVPDDLHAKLKARATREKLTFSSLLLREATRLANQLTVEELSDRISRWREPANVPAETIVEIIREARGPLPSEPLPRK